MYKKTLSGRQYPSIALQAEMYMIAYMPDTSCPVTLVSLGIALQASDVIDGIIWQI